MSVWSSRVDDVKDLIADVRAEIASRDQKRLEGADTSAIDTRINGDIRHLDQNLRRLDEDLRSDTRDRRTQLARRKDLDNLRHAVAQLRRDQRREVQTAERAHLLAGGGGSPRPMYDPTRDMNTRQLLQRHEEAEKAQDEIIDELAVGVSGLKILGKNIGDEADLQVRLLDDFETDVEKGRRNLNRETAHAKKANRQAQGVCWMYVVICLLILVLLGLVIFLFA